MPSTPPAVRQTQAARRGEAEGALLDAAVRLFARKGIDRTSLADIGEAAGYSRGLVNHHFGSKAVLVERLAARAQGRFVAQLLPSGGDEIDALVGMARMYFDFVRRDITSSRAFLVMWGSALPGDAALRPVFVTDDARFRDGVADIVGAGQRNATIDATLDTAAFAFAFVGLLRGTTAQLLIDPDAVDLTRAGDICERFVRSALSPRGSAECAR